MEKSEDKVMKEMFALSKIELLDPEFDRTVMALVSAAERRRNVIRVMKFVFTAMLIEGAIFWILWSYPDVAHKTIPLNLWPWQLIDTLTGIGEWVFENYYFTLPLLILSILKRILESRLRYSDS